MDCVRGECVSRAAAGGYREDWRKIPESLDTGTCSSMDELRGYRRMFKEYVEDLQGQLGQRIPAGFAYCTCEKGRKIVFERAVGLSAVKSLSERLRGDARRRCGGCAGNPVVERVE